MRTIQVAWYYEKRMTNCVSMLSMECSVLCVVSRTIAKGSWHRDLLFTSLLTCSEVVSAHSSLRPPDSGLGSGSVMMARTPLALGRIRSLIVFPSKVHDGHLSHPDVAKPRLAKSFGYAGASVVLYLSVVSGAVHRGAYSVFHTS